MTIRLEHIWKSFGAVEVLKDVDLELPERQFITLVGPSGCGKTTLLRIIAAAIFSLIVSWNDYLFARVFINSIENLPLTVGVMHFFEGTHVDWGLMMASAVLMTLPMAILFMLMQRHLVAGFGAGAVKG